jgi:hypothetical protein
MYHTTGVKSQTNYFVFTLKMEISGDSEKLVTTYLDTWTYKHKTAIYILLHMLKAEINGSYNMFTS